MKILCVWIAENYVDPDNLPKLKEDLKSVTKKFRKCGVLKLSYLLWPSLDAEIREKYHVAANTELVAFVEKCWRFWQEKAGILNLPFIYRRSSDSDIESEKKKTNSLRIAKVS
eukprot:Pompholyxophrys_sp_v1_NODE_105_length_1967_cov_3.812762.p2 type:complete len:113 gc:universal NODE_105_length_1967_cov_3.812762:371-709(+)